jgi:hypothetical protein
MFEPVNTNVAAIPIPIPFLAIVVTAREGHMPNTIFNTGFSFISPFVKTEKALDDGFAISIPFFH